MAEIVLINPRFTPSYWGWEHALPMLRAKALFPPINLTLLAALTPPGHNVAIIDENVEEIDWDRCDRADIVGNDGGAALAWALDSFAPGHVDHLAVLSVGHPSTLRRTLEQRQKSWYMLLFQFEGVAERWRTDDNWANLRRGHPDGDQAAADMEANGSLVPGLNWYRANVGPETWVGPQIAWLMVGAETTWPSSAKATASPV